MLNNKSWKETRLERWEGLVVVGSGVGSFKSDWIKKVQAYNTNVEWRSVGCVKEIGVRCKLWIEGNKEQWVLMAGGCLPTLFPQAGVS